MMDKSKMTKLNPDENINVRLAWLSDGGPFSEGCCASVVGEAQRVVPLLALRRWQPRFCWRGCLAEERDARGLRRGATRSDWTRSGSTGGARAKNIPPVCYITRVKTLLNHWDPSAIWSPGDANLMDRIPARIHPSYWCCDAFRHSMIQKYDIVL